jgi:hypothetical protein
VEADGLFGRLGANFVGINARRNAITQRWLAVDIDVNSPNRGRERDVPRLNCGV